jgi:uncharacterized protein YbjT (DUF2867 family)
MDRPAEAAFTSGMTNSTILITGVTGKTGRRLADQLDHLSVPTRRVSRRSEIPFDWDDPSTYDRAIEGVDAVYLVQPPARFDHAPLVARFLDQAESAGVRHVTLLSARGVDHAPDEVPMRSIEIDLIGRTGITHSILRPGWFLQDFTEWFWHPSIVEQGTIRSPAASGAEAFVAADDIASVAKETLLHEGHAGAQYELTGPEALTFDEVAAAISVAAGRAVVHQVVTPDEWVREAGAVDLPGDYAAMLAALLAGIDQGTGAATTNDIERVTGRPARSLATFLAALDGSTWRPSTQ